VNWARSSDSVTVMTGPYPADQVSFASTCASRSRHDPLDFSMSALFWGQVSGQVWAGDSLYHSLPLDSAGVIAFPVCARQDDREEETNA
jgi:hypothetical protein